MKIRVEKISHFSTRILHVRKNLGAISYLLMD